MKEAPARGRIYSEELRAVLGAPVAGREGAREVGEVREERRREVLQRRRGGRREEQRDLLEQHGGAWREAACRDAQQARIGAISKKKEERRRRWRGQSGVCANIMQGQRASRNRVSCSTAPSAR